MNGEAIAMQTKASIEQKKKSDSEEETSRESNRSMAKPSKRGKGNAEAKEDERMFDVKRFEIR